MKRYMLYLEHGLYIDFDTQKSAKDFLYKDLLYFTGNHYFMLYDRITCKGQYIKYYNPIRDYDEFDTILLPYYVTCEFTKWK
jgi:hypothetical protein